MNTKRITINLQSAWANRIGLIPHYKEIEDFLKDKVDYNRQKEDYKLKYGKEYPLPFHPTSALNTILKKRVDLSIFDNAESYDYWYADVSQCVLEVECGGEKTFYPNEKLKARPFGPLSKPVTKYKWMEKTGGSDEEWQRRCDIIDKNFALTSDDKDFRTVMKYLQKCQDEDRHPEHYNPFAIIYIKECMKSRLSALRSKKSGPLQGCEINSDFVYMQASSGHRLTASFEIEIEGDFDISKFRLVRDKKWYNRCMGLENVGFDFHGADVLTSFIIYDNRIYSLSSIRPGEIDESLFTDIDISDEEVRNAVIKTVDLELRPVSK